MTKKLKIQMGILSSAAVIALPVMMAVSCGKENKVSKDKPQQHSIANGKPQNPTDANKDKPQKPTDVNKDKPQQPTIPTEKPQQQFIKEISNVKQTREVAITGKTSEDEISKAIMGLITFAIESKSIDEECAIQKNIFDDKLIDEISATSSNKQAKEFNKMKLDVMKSIKESAKILTSIKEFNIDGTNKNIKLNSDAQEQMINYFSLFYKANSIITEETQSLLEKKQMGKEKLTDSENKKIQEDLKIMNDITTAENLLKKSISKMVKDQI